MNVNTLIAVKWLIGDRLEARGVAAGDDISEPPNKQRGVSLLGGAELRIDTKVKSKGATPEPDPTTRGKVRWFLFFLKAENIHIKRARNLLSRGGHCYLHVIKSDNFTYQERPHLGRYQRIGRSAAAEGGGRLQRRSFTRST